MTTLNTKTIRFTEKWNLKKSEPGTTISMKGLKKWISKNTGGFEIIDGNCLPYFDYDFDHNETNSDPVESLFALHEKIQTVYPCGTIYMFSACNKAKTSYHFIVRGAGYYKQGFDIPRIEGFDHSVYNHAGKRQLFRLPFCTKKGHDRYLIRIMLNGDTYKTIDECEDMCEYLADYMITLTSGEKLIKASECLRHSNTEVEVQETVDVDTDEILKKVNNAFPDFEGNHKYHRTTGNRLNFKRILPSHCNYCDRTHSRDNTAYVVVYKDKSIFLGCTKSKKKQKHVWSPNLVNQPVVTNGFAEVIKSCKANLPATIKSIKDGFSNLVETSQKYVSDIPQFMNSKHEILSIRSNMGTGKTHAVSKMVKDMPKKNRIGIISFRISLAEKYKEDYDAFCYNDDKKIAINHDRWICQLDSLHRVKWTRAEGKNVCDLLIIDEVTQAIRHLSAKTFMSGSCARENLARLTFLIKYSKQIVLMDANLTQYEIDYIRRLRNSPTDTYLTIWNSPLVEAQTLRITKRKETVSELIKLDIKNKRKFYLANNGTVKSIKTLAVQLGGNILVICSKTVKKKLVIKALANPNIEFGKYDGLIVSPSIQSGISYDILNTFSNIYGMFGNGSNSSMDCCQMLRRIRHPINNTITVSIEAKSGNSKPTTKDSFISHMIANRKSVLEDCNYANKVCEFGINDYGVKSFKNDAYFNLFVETKVRENLDKIRFAKNFISHQLVYGHEVEIMDDFSKAVLKKNRDEFNDITSRLAEEHHNNLNGAKNISMDEYEKIKKDMEDGVMVSEERLLESNKKFLEMVYNVELLQNEVNTTWFETYTDRATLQAYKNLEPYYENNRSMAETVEYLKQREVAKQDDRQMGDITSAVISSLADKPKYARQNMLIDWVSMMGYSALSGEVEEIKDADMLVNLGNLFDKYFTNGDNFTNMINILGKSKQKLISMKALKRGDKRFVQDLLRFINGSLKTEWKISIKKKDRNCGKYILFNPLVNEGIFVDTFGVYNAKFDKQTPLLGYHPDYEHPVEVDPVEEKRLLDNAMVALGLEVC